MKTVLPSSSAIDRMFAAMFLFTGAADKAEEAILKGIASVDPDGQTGCEQLLLHASIAAAGTQDDLLSPLAAAVFVPGLPEEMHRVLGLPRELRSCFVLRVLLSMPAEQCSRLLNLTTERINADVGLAIRRLAVEDDVRPQGLLPISNEWTLWQGEFQLA